MNIPYEMEKEKENLSPFISGTAELWKMDSQSPASPWWAKDSGHWVHVP